jgi:nucleoid-associated protein YgaU
VGTGGGELERLTITYERRRRRTGSLTAMFNPSEIRLSRSLRWEEPRRASHSGAGYHDANAEFRYVEAETFSIELFFDTYESRSGMSLSDVLVPVNPFQQSGATDVRRHTDQVALLAEVNRELHRPPICRLQWGTFDIFTGVLTGLEQRFTMFLEDGTPVRATVTCTFLESLPPQRGRARELHSADVTKTRQVRRNDTLQSIAAEEYNDPGLWRHIATANGIVNPRTVAPGTVLTIPKLRT